MHENDSEDDVPSQPALSVNAKSRSGCTGFIAGLIAFLFCSAFLFAGAAVIWVSAVGPAIQILMAYSWVETPCKILSSKVVGDETFRIDIRFEYEVDQQRYEGDRYSFYVMSTSGRAAKQNVVDLYPIGSQALCYVDPDNPAKSVISRNVSTQSLWGLLGLPFFAVGAVGIYAVFLSTRSNTAQSASLNDLENTPDEEERLSAISPIVSKDNDFSEYNLREEPGPMSLVAADHPVGGFLGLLFFALIWNGVVGIFLYVRWKEIAAGKWEFLPDILIILFGGIGLLVLWGAFLAFLKLFNPKPVLMLSRTLIPLGGTAQLNWSFDGGGGSIKQLKLTVKGIERVTYVQGTDTKTDESIFHEETLIETTEQTEIAAGTVNVTIPANSMHSLTAPNNKIIWQITLHGQIPNWPDVKSTSPIRVVPHE